MKKTYLRVLFGLLDRIYAEEELRQASGSRHGDMVWCAAGYDGVTLVTDLTCLSSRMSYQEEP